MLFRRWFSSSSPGKRYLEKVRLMEYWRVQDEALKKEFPRSKLLLMVDKSPLVVRSSEGVRMAVNSFIDLKKHLGDYGVHFDIAHSSLLDAVEEDGQLIPLFGTAVITESPPEGSPVDKRKVIRELAKTLGGTFIDIRLALLTMTSEEDRNLLCRFQSLTKWSRIFIRCPRCATALSTYMSKSSATCRTCDMSFYPQVHPATISLIRDRSDTHALLVRHRNYGAGMYTCIAGFAEVGESMHQCVRREAAEEVGIVLDEVRVVDGSQPWPLPDGSLMCPHMAVADRTQQLEVCPSELESAVWFTRDAVGEALERTLKDPFLKGLPSSLEDRQKLLYVPPPGAIAHHLISDWVNRKL